MVGIQRTDTDVPVFVSIDPRAEISHMAPALPGWE